MLSTTQGGYALPFEAVSMLLLAAMIGCIVIAMRSPVPTNGKAREKEIEEIKEESITIVTPVKEKSEINSEIQQIPSRGDIGEAL